jgi:hypothetical protein
LEIEKIDLISFLNEYLASRNHFSTIKLTFSDQLNDASIGIWYSDQTSWQIKPSICKLNTEV